MALKIFIEGEKYLVSYGCGHSEYNGFEELVEGLRKILVPSKVVRTEPQNHSSDTELSDKSRTLEVHGVQGVHEVQDVQNNGSYETEWDGERGKYR